MLDDIGKYTVKHGCLCNIAKVAFVREATEQDEENGAVDVTINPPGTKPEDLRPEPGHPDYKNP